MFEWLASLAGFATPLFLILSPLLSYSDQAYSMYRNKSSKGFSLDIPLIMLVASLLRIFYYPGARFDMALLVQSFVMIAIQIILLKVALDHRPPPSTKGGDMATPFSSAKDYNIFTRPRPYSFWQWRSSRPYWQFLLYMFITLTALELLLAPAPNVYSWYSPIIGYLGLSVEATLPLPQIFSNHRSRSCKGFRLSVLASWLLGDAMKMYWFFTSTSEIPWAFKLCGIFQAACDCLLGIQYWMYGEGDGSVAAGPSVGGGAIEEKQFQEMGAMKIGAYGQPGVAAGGLGGTQWKPRAPSASRPGTFSPRRSMTPVGERTF